MKNNQLTVITITALILCASAGAAQGPCSADGVWRDGKCEREYKIAPRPGRPEYSLRASWDPEEVPQKVTVEISSGSGAPVQTVTGPSEESADRFAGIENHDVNFDGARDLVLQWAIGAKNGTCDVWLFDPQTNNFFTRQDLQGLEQVFEVDPQTRTVKTAGQGSGFGWYWVTTLKTMDGKLTPVEIESQRWLTQPFAYYYRTREQREGRTMKTVEESIFTITDSGEPDKYSCGPGPAPMTCGALLAVIEFTGAEQERDAGAMAGSYTDTVLWNGRARPRAELKTMHARYLDAIAEGSYELKLADFHQVRDDAGGRAVVEARVDGSYQDKQTGTPKKFAIRKRWRLALAAGAWKIECEEVAQYLDGTKAKTSALCRLPE